MKSQGARLLWQYVISGFLLCNAIILFTFVIHLSKGEPLSFIYQLKNNPSFFAVCFTSFILIPVFFLFGKGRLYLLMIKEKARHSEEAKNQLLEELSDYKFALDQSAMITVIDKFGKIKSVNNTFLCFTGYTSEEVIGKSILRLPSSLHNKKLFRQIKKSVEAGNVWKGDIDYYKPGGIVGYTSGLIIPLSKYEGAVGDCLVIQFDMSAEKMAEIALRESEKDKNILLSNTRAIICTHSTDGILTSINKAGLDILKLSESELIGKPFSDMVDKKFLLEYEQYLQSVNEKGFAEGMMLLVDSTGKRKTIYYRNVLSGQHQKKYIIGSAIDITDTLDAKREIENQRIFQQQILDISPNIICVSDENGKFILCNKKFRSVFGCNVEGKVVSDFPDDFKRKLLSLINPPHKIGSSAFTTYEWSINSPVYTNELHYSVYRTSFIENSGKSYTLIIATDVSEKHGAQVALQKAHSLVEKSLKIKEQFIANMSHEIRTPLNAIIGFTDLLTESPLDSQQKDYVQTVKIAGQNLLGIINDILDLSKIEAGVISIENKALNICHQVRNMEKLFEPKVREKGIFLNVNIADDVPCFVNGDAGRLTQVLINLVGNAVKFTDKGGVNVSVHKIDGPDSDKVYIHFIVKDTGIGIAQDKTKVIFDRFEQASPDTHKFFGGTGLGLNIAKNLLELFGGNIKIQSEIGVGSTFDFIIPFELATVKAIAEVFDEENDAKLNIKRPVKILLAEDNMTNAKLAKQILAKHGFNVHHVRDGFEVMDALDVGQYDLILMDIQMGGRDGIETTKLIRLSDAEYNIIPVIALTAHSFSGEKNICSEAGMNAYISKPFSPQQLFAAINKVLAAKEIDLLVTAVTARPINP